MLNDMDLWVNSAKADFEAAAHRGARISDLSSACTQIEDMLQSIALGLNELTEAVLTMNQRLEHIDQSIRTQQK